MAIVGVKSSLVSTSSYQKVMSSAVKGAPSDQRKPSRNSKVNSVASSLPENDLATPGIKPVQSGVKRIRFSYAIRRIIHM